MSTTSSLLLLLLCLSFYVCNARRLIDISKESEKQSHFSTKSNEKVISPVKKILISGPKVKPSLWENEVNGVGIIGEKLVIKASEVHKDENKKPRPSKKDEKELKVSGSAKSESLASASSQVFNTDYPLPDVHPPVHN